MKTKNGLQSPTGTLEEATMPSSISIPIVPHPSMVDKTPLLDQAQEAFFIAELARLSGDYNGYWHHRRQGLLLQAEWYAHAHKGKEQQ